MLQDNLQGTDKEKKESRILVALTVTEILRFI